mmetsp:Transcript_16628/g.53527  ORF Transcript_16628/g.53527 Transcript_16628/m.53527 type:complete len:494 (-) Transcript_16628:95-1576(-)
MVTGAWEPAQPVRSRIDWCTVLASGPRYVARTCLLSLALFTVAAVLMLPLTVLARRGFEDIVRKGGSAAGFGGTECFQHPSGMWKTTAFMVLYNTYQSFAQLASRWAVMGVAWQGWNMARGKPLAITVVTMCWYILCCFFVSVLRNYNLISAGVWMAGVVVLATPPNFLMVVSVTKLSSRVMTWRTTLKLITWSTCLEWWCALMIHCSLFAFYQADGGVARVAIRLIPVMVRRVWLHGSCLLSLRFHINQEENRFLLMALPIGSTAMAGTAMQLVSSSDQVVAMSIVMMVLEVIDALLLLSGTTTVEWTRLWFLSIWQRSSKHLSSVFPGGSEEDDGQEEKIRQAKEEETREQRRPLLAAAAVQVCVSELSSMMLLSMQLLMLPITTGGKHAPRYTELGREMLITRFVISMAFELLGDGVTAMLSSFLSQVWPHKYNSAISARRGLRLNSYSMANAYAIMAFTSVDYLGLFLSSLCVYPRGSSFVLDNCETQG